MSEPFLGEIRLFPISYVPRGWVACEGQILQINSNQALYALLGTTYGGNGQTTFALPDYRGRTPIHCSPSFPLGQAGGEENHVLTVNEMPQHTHQIQASSSEANEISPLNNVWATTTTNNYGQPGASQYMNTGSISVTGKSQAHPNMQPYLALRFCIATVGIFPSRN